MLKKIIHPKILAIITIILFVIGSIFSCLGANLFTTILRGGFLGYFYIMIYLLIILFAKNKNIRKLNLIMIIQLIISLIFSYFIATNGILNIVLYAVLIVMIIGIYLHKKIPYKMLMIISLCVLGIEIITTGRLFVVGNFGALGIQKIIYIKGSNSVYSVGMLVEKIICSIGLCSFIMFIYQYGKSISERWDKNE